LVNNIKRFSPLSIFWLNKLECFCLSLPAQGSEHGIFWLFSFIFSEFTAELQRLSIS